MNFLLQAARRAPGVASKVFGAGRQFLTGLRSTAPRVVSGIAAEAPSVARGVASSVARVAAPAATSVTRPGIVQTLTRPLSLSRAARVTPPPATIATRPALRVAEEVSTGAKSANQALDELAQLAKVRAPEVSKDVNKYVSAAKKGNLTADEALVEAQRRLINVVDEVPNPAAAAFAEQAAAREATARGLRRVSTIGATGAALAPTVYTGVTGEEAPAPLQVAAGFAAGIPGARMLGSGLSNLLRGQRGTLRTLGGAALAGLGASQIAGIGRPAAAATAMEQVPETPIFPQDQAPTEAAAPAVDPMQEALDQINAQAQVQLDAVDQSIAGALDELIAAYGGDAAFNDAIAANDQMLAMELAAIEADANAARAQISANYDAALAQIAQYTDQASQALSQAAAEQQAAFETASGGLETAQVPAGMGAAEAAAAGLSGTALGGAGVTGAALARTQAAASASQAAADKAAVVTSLSDQAATGRLDQAAMLAALDAGIINAQQAARIDSANRKSEIRAARDQQRIQLAGIKYEATVDAANKKAQIEAQRIANEVALKEMYAKLTPEQRAAYSGKPAAQRKSPAWATIQGGNQDATVGTFGLTRRDRNQIVETLVAYAQDAQAYSERGTALQYWNAVLQELRKSDPAISRKLEDLGLPSTATQLVNEFVK